MVHTRQFEETSSTKLELQTLLWALHSIDKDGVKIHIYTDSQNIISLPQRRSRFESNHYQSKKKKTIANALFYQEFYTMLDSIEYALFKVKGHKLAQDKDKIDTIFTLVDKASRNALRELLG